MWEQEGLARTEEKIRALKQKIAETERRKRLKKILAVFETPASTLQQTPKSPSARSISPAVPVARPESIKNTERVLEAADLELQPITDGW